MASNVVGLFDLQSQADNAVRQLLAANIEPKYISVIAADPVGKIHREVVDKSGENASAGALTGAASGLIVGGLIGLLIGATVLVPPAGMVVAGPIAGLIAGAGLGFSTGGVLGAIIGLGVPADEAQVYSESVRRGGVLVAVDASELDRVRIEQILAMAGAVDISERAAHYRATGFTEYDPKAPVFTPEEIAAERVRLGLPPLMHEPMLGETIWGEPVLAEPIVVEPLAVEVIPMASVPPGAPPVPLMPMDSAIVTDKEAAIAPTLLNSIPAMDSSVAAEQLAMEADRDSAFMRDFEENTSGLAFESFRPAYNFGYECALRPEFRNYEWISVEPQAKALWEGRNPGTWDKYSHAIYFGWQQAAAHINSSGAMVL